MYARAPVVARTQSLRVRQASVAPRPDQGVVGVLQRVGIDEALPGGVEAEGKAHGAGPLWVAKHGCYFLKSTRSLVEKQYV